MGLARRFRDARRLRRTFVIDDRGEGSIMKPTGDGQAAPRDTAGQPSLDGAVLQDLQAAQVLQEGPRFKVRCLTLAPGETRSPERHYHHAEQWIVVSGTALAHRDGEDLMLRETQSMFIPLGTAHGLTNPGKIPLVLIEVQMGCYLADDDVAEPFPRIYLPLEGGGRSAKSDPSDFAVEVELGQARVR
jgi:mannose-6-phosphate isomerase-like protein (cupin superfamily)